jgi:peroxiredoxin
MQETLLRLNDTLPRFDDLPGADGKSYSSSDFDGKPILVVVFSCNHCPYVKAYERRMIDLQREYAPKGVQLIAINSNETKNYPEDRFEEMVRHAKEMKFTFPYLRDEHQTIAGAFGATHTPQFFVFDRERTLRYLGKMDDNWQHPEAVKEEYLRDAIDAILEGKKVAVPETYSIGCTIKWA